MKYVDVYASMDIWGVQMYMQGEKVYMQHVKI